MQITALDLAQRFVGTEEISGSRSKASILAMLKLDHSWPDDDEVPWCSAFVNYVTWLLRLPRSKSLRARSWLNVGTAVPLSDVKPGFDIVVLNRGGGKQPGPEDTTAPGHVGFYAGVPTDRNMHVVPILGGNQSNSVCVQMYDVDRVLGVRRIWQGCKQ